MKNIWEMPTKTHSRLSKKKGLRMMGYLILYEDNHEALYPNCL